MTDRTEREEFVVVPRELLSDLWRYGNLRPCDGVIYGKTHRVRLKEADDILCRAMLSASPASPAQGPETVAGPWGGEALLKQARDLCEAIERLPGGEDQTKLITLASGAAHALQELQRTGSYFWPTPAYDDYQRGQRDALSAVLSLNPTAAAKVAHWAEKEPDPDGRLPFDVVMWVSVVAEQLGFETLEGDGPERFKPAHPASPSPPAGQEPPPGFTREWMIAQEIVVRWLVGSGDIYISHSGDHKLRPLIAAIEAALLRSLKSPHSPEGEE